MLEKYRRSMNDDVLHSWAKDAQKKLDLVSVALSTLLDTVEPTYKRSEEGRDFLENARKDLNI